MVLTADDLHLRYSDYTDIRGKIRRDVQSGKLIQIARGLYETDVGTDGKYLAGYIYGPSYLSFDYALAYYSLIPESVYKTYTSATFSKNRKKRYENIFGLYTYRDVPKDVFSLGVKICVENGYSYQIASPEKALCDKLYTLPPISTLSGIKELLFSDLRLDESGLKNLNFEDIRAIAPLYRCNNLNMLLKFFNRGAL